MAFLDPAPCYALHDFTHGRDLSWQSL
jgi:hypothetical protein